MQWMHTDCIMSSFLIFCSLENLPQPNPLRCKNSFVNLTLIVQHSDTNRKIYCILVVIYGDYYG